MAIEEIFYTFFQTVKRQHRAEYQKHKDQIKTLEEKLAMLKEKAASEQIKQKKKSRVPEPQGTHVIQLIV